MLISLNWLRDYVDIPADTDPHALGERVTVTVAEVDGVEQVDVAACGLIAAQVVSAAEISGARDLRHVILDVGGGKRVETVSAAPVLRAGDRVVFAPVGASVRNLGEIRASAVGGRESHGMILPGEAVGIAMAVREAVFLPPDVAPGTPLAAELFDDWVIEIDNKAITHRPDLWGHYGIAREVAALLRLPLKPLPVAPASELTNPSLPEIPITIADPDKCPRYSALMLRGVSSQPAPLWMQLRLGHVGLRPIDGLVDLTNYVMCDLGQPMHAFDGDKVAGIRVAVGETGSTFATLDGVGRKLPGGALMIQAVTDSRGARRLEVRDRAVVPAGSAGVTADMDVGGTKNVAIAGVMGGRETEVSATTRSILLESANFEPATIRRCAAALGLRTDASARFEKSLDPAHTVLAIQRFVHLGRQAFGDLSLASRLSDAYPKPAQPVSIDVDPAFVSRFVGRTISVDEITDILTRLEFRVHRDGLKLRVDVPSFRATKDIRLEVDIIEEVARFIGFGNISPELPEATVRCFTPNTMHELESATLTAICEGRGYSEIHQYIWDDAGWLRKLGLAVANAIELRNPAAEDLHQLRQTLMPGLLSAVERNRHHFGELKLLEIGSVVWQDSATPTERRKLGLIVARRQKGVDDALLGELKGDLDTWANLTLNRAISFSVPKRLSQPWEPQHRTADVSIADIRCGRVGVLPLALKRTIDEHLTAWSVAWAEIELDELAKLEPVVEKLAPLPEFPQVELDFSFVVPATERYVDIRQRLAAFKHPLLLRLSYVGVYEGKSVGDGLRSLTVRASIAANDRTLTEVDSGEFRGAVEAFLQSHGYPLRG